MKEAKETTEDTHSIATQLINKVSNTVHNLIDDIEELTSGLQQKEPGEFQVGDLAISPVDIIVDKEIKYKAGEVFRFVEELVPFLTAPLFEPDIKRAVIWARIHELDALGSRGRLMNNVDISNNTKCLFTLESLELYIKTRKAFIQESLI